MEEKEGNIRKATTFEVVVTLTAGAFALAFAILAGIFG